MKASESILFFLYVSVVAYTEGNMYWARSDREGMGG